MLLISHLLTPACFFSFGASGVKTAAFFFLLLTFTSKACVITVLYLPLSGLKNENSMDGILYSPGFADTKAYRNVLLPVVGDICLSRNSLTCGSNPSTPAGHCTTGAFN